MKNFLYSSNSSSKAQKDKIKKKETAVKLIMILKIISYSRHKILKLPNIPVTLNKRFGSIFSVLRKLSSESSVPAGFGSVAYIN